MQNQNTDSIKAGTGFMLTMTEALQQLKGQGYTENLVPKYDHFECQSGKFKLYPNDFVVDELVRIENSSDPDDQSAVYAISSPSQKLKGVYVDSYGLYHDDLSNSILERLKDHIH